MDVLFDRLMCMRMYDCVRCRCVYVSVAALHLHGSRTLIITISINRVNSVVTNSAGSVVMYYHEWHSVVAFSITAQRNIAQHGRASFPKVQHGIVWNILVRIHLCICM